MKSPKKDGIKEPNIFGTCTVQADSITQTNAHNFTPFLGVRLEILHSFAVGHCATFRGRGFNYCLIFEKSRFSGFGRDFSCPEHSGSPEKGENNLKVEKPRPSRVP